MQLKMQVIQDGAHSMLKFYSVLVATDQTLRAA